VKDLALRVRDGQRLGIHCWGSIGRATVTAACTLIHLGWEPPEAALPPLKPRAAAPSRTPRSSSAGSFNYEAGSRDGGQSSRPVVDFAFSRTNGALRFSPRAPSFCRRATLFIRLRPKRSIAARSKF
jgi:hypothetical protein